MLDLIILAAIAGFFLYRLWAVLGARTGHESTPDAPAPDSKRTPAPRPGADETGVVRPSGKPATAPGPILAPAVQRGVQEINSATRGFDVAAFLSGAQSAHEEIIARFAEGDRAALKPLLGDEVYAAFEASIASREADAHTMTSTIVKQDSPQMVSAVLKGRNAEIGVRYVSEIIQFTKNAAGEIVSGNDTQVRQVVDRWTWMRDVTSADPNWKLVDTDYDD
jgi:predicted lipid-binding transport protein (Tim44 family)